jgi:putative SOS response-associated peptidase YedK
VGKQPYNVGLASGEPFSFAGLWENWTNSEGEKVQTCTIITTTPNEFTERVHNRMPVILPRSRVREWLDPEQSVEDLKALLVPHPAIEMKMYLILPRLRAPISL